MAYTIGEREWAAVGFGSDEYRTMVRARAIHEAGHAVIARVLNMLCGHTTIEPDADSGGHGIIYDPYDIYDAWERQGRYRNLSTVLVGRIMSFMAGRRQRAPPPGMGPIKRCF